jgi:SLT domain-containing protein
MSASPDALRIYVVASKQGASSRGMMNAISRTANSTSNTALSLLGGGYTSGATAIEYKRIEFELLKVLWRDSEGPDEKVSRHTVCLLT